MDTDGFGDLLHQAQQLTADMDTGDSMPRVERNLFQIKDAAVKMAYKTPFVSTDSSDVKASLLLGSKGYEVQRVSQKLEGLNAAKTFEPLEPVRDTDIQGFLKNERENALLAAIEQTRKNTFEEASLRHWEGMENDWEKEKLKLLGSLVDSAAETLDFMADQESLLSTSISMQGRTTLNSVELAYSRQVSFYNDNVRQSAIRPSLVKLFVDLESKSDNVAVKDIWNLVSYMSDIPQPMSAAMDSTYRTSPAMQAVIVRQALQYLQTSYMTYIETKVRSNLQQAQRGGVPGTYNAVRSFLNVQLRSASLQQYEDGLVEAHPTWAMIYYCFRCGDLAATQQAVDRGRQHLGEFPRFFLEYASSDIRRLSADSEREVRLQYQRTVRTSTDPYKRAMYCLVGRCDSREDHGEVAPSADDYLWLKLSQVTVDDEDGGAKDKLTLSQLQTLLLEEYGESHFQATDQPYLYFRVLFVTGQFEAAIEFLARIERLRVYAVHIALAMYENGLLLMPDNIHATIVSRDSSSSAPIRRLNFVRLITMYTKKFEMTDPREALQCFYFLRDLRAADGQSNLFLTCVSELVLETREFDVLLGQLQVDGSRRPGAIDKFHADSSETQLVIETVARTTEEKGQLEDAVKLYDLAKNAAKVIELLNKLISQVLSQPPAVQSPKDRIQQTAIVIAHRYKAQGIEGSPAAMQTFHLQLDLMTFFDLYHTGKHEQAYKIIQDVKLLPLSVEMVDHNLKAFRELTDEIRRSLPDILLATMSILLAQYRKLKGGQGIQSGLVASPGLGRQEDSMKPMIKKAAQAIIMFTGMIPYRMPGDTNARLVQMEILMN